MVDIALGIGLTTVVGITVAIELYSLASGNIPAAALVGKGVFRAAVIDTTKKPYPHAQRPKGAANSRDAVCEPMGSCHRAIGFLWRTCRGLGGWFFEHVCIHTIVLIRNFVHVATQLR